MSDESDGGSDGAGGSATYFDRPLAVTIPARHARGRIVRLGPVLDTILSAHDYPEPIARVLAEALVLTALLGSTLKQAGGQLTLQAQTEAGIIELLVCDFREGELRGYVKFDMERFVEVPADPSLFALFGKGYLAVTFDRPAGEGVDGERYQGIVPLDGASIAEAAQSYLVQSEQLPSLVRISADCGTPGEHVAGGIMIQHLPEGEEGRERLHTRLDHPEWDHVRALAETIKPEELLDPALSLEEIAWRLFHEDEVRVLAGDTLTRGCRCDAAYLAGVLARFPEDERREMADENGTIPVDCAFCAKIFAIPAGLDPA
ncbi:Hsp33 family molecular chaperone HslO [Sphingorhabdus soli]|uniref:Hsp33 family molecular chaperone HslO n=1 Tax=Flavisphingopyxis soli TaxID=2601267 RepID=A0A5C6UNF3_9SPHN|nr:Hsp33 family molecular chaperone HslO [Sphingorhabdus soli]TXC74120.1 Hsp33 family molecular chaperone HslO [Sphingorhabdus soli]